MPKSMRSTKDGSTCADCGTEIKTGDPIAYFGPGRVYGLQCHTNEKTRKYLSQLLAEEKMSDTKSPSQQQEWIVRWEWTPSLSGTPELRFVQLLLKGAYCYQVTSAFNVIEWRAPRGCAALMTKVWSEGFARALNEMYPEFGKAEGMPRWD